MEKNGINMCCLISRIASVVLNDFNYLDSTDKNNAIITEKYKRIVEKISSELNIEKISVVPVSITSNFNNLIKTVSGIEIIIEDNQHEIKIPNDIYIKLHKLFNKNVNKTAPIVKFGFLNRTLNKNVNGFNGSITTGSHSADLNYISIDILVHDLLGVEALALKLVHELLHDIGFQETQVLSLEKKVYKDLRLELVEFTNMLYEKLLKEKSDFIKKLNKVVDKSETEFLGLIEIAEELFGRGFPIPHNSTSNITVFNPITGNKAEVLLF